MSYQSVGVTGVTSFNKIPEYARDFKNEYLFIRGINKEFKYVVESINEATRGLFENHGVDRIKKLINKFLLAQKLGYPNDVSNFEIESSEFKFNQYIQFCKDCYDEDDQIFVDPYPGFKNIYDDYELFCSKFKINCEDSDSDSDSDSDGVNSDDLENLFSDSDSDSDSVDLENLFSDSDSDSDTDDLENLFSDSDSD